MDTLPTEVKKHYDCFITKNGGEVFCARFQKADDAVNFQKRNKIVSVTEVVNDYYYNQGLDPKVV